VCRSCRRSISTTQAKQINKPSTPKQQDNKKNTKQEESGLTDLIKTLHLGTSNPPPTPSQSSKSNVSKALDLGTATRRISFNNDTTLSSLETYLKKMRRNQEAVQQSHSRPSQYLLQNLDVSKLQKSASLVPDHSALSQTAHQTHEATTRRPQDIEMEADLRKRLGRVWVTGDVYTPRDIGPVEQGKWRIKKERQKHGDVFELMGKNPLSYYKVSKNKKKPGFLGTGTCWLFFWQSLLTFVCVCVIELYGAGGIYERVRTDQASQGNKAEA
jgi:hypothetical protein